MGRAPKVSATAVATAIRQSKTEPLEIKQHFLKLRIKRTTQDQYASHISWLKGILQELGEPLSEPIFLKILHHAAQHYEGHKAEQLRDALMYHQQTTGEFADQTWITSDTMKRVCQGFLYQGGKAPQTTRGSATPEQVEMFIQNLRTHNKFHFATMVRLQFEAGLRTQELISIQSGDYDPATRTLLIRSNKAAKASNGKPNHYIKSILSDTADTLLRSLQEITAKSDFLFHPRTHPRQEYNSLFRQHFPELRDHPDLVFVPHSLRHGHIAKNKQLISTINNLASTVTSATMQQSMMSRYGKSNKDRSSAIKS
jgi:integrase